MNINYHQLTVNDPFNFFVFICDNLLTHKSSTEFFVDPSPILLFSVEIFIYPLYLYSFG